MLVASRVPAALARHYPQASLAKTALAALEDAGRVDPDGVGGDVDLRSATVYLSEAHRSDLRQHMRAGEEEKDTLTRVLCAILEWRERQVSETTPSVWDVPGGGNGLRPLQRKLARAALPALQRGKIVLAEGGTGLGKSRVIAMAAHAALSHGVKVVVATPSIMVMNQILDGEWQYLVPPGCVSALLLGRGQFVDPEAVLAILGNPECEFPAAQAIRDWIAAGGPSTAPTALLRGPLAFLREELERIDPTFPAGECLALDGQNELIEEQIAQMRAAAGAADAVFATHSAVASSIRLERFGRDALVPLAGRCLLVDEAHLLEGFMASAVSTGVSVFHARLRLQEQLAAMPNTRNRTAIAHVVEELRRWSTPAGDGLQTLPRHGDDTTFLTAERGDQSMRRVISTLIDTLGAHGDRLRKAGGYAREFAETIITMANALRGESGMVVQLSPTRRYPTITVGARSLQSTWEDLWARLHSGLLCSGTLTVLDKLGGASYRYVASNLAIPAGRVEFVEPAIPEWLYSPLVLTPSPASAPSLVPPGEDVDAEIAEGGDAYYGHLARQIRAVYDSAKGGVLVLCTSYRAIQAIAQRLDLDDLVVQTHATSLSALKREFIARATAGKPIWLGTGAAWTGLDLKGSATDAADDHLLTDVVVLRVPMPVPNTVPTLWRAQRMGFDSTRIESCFVFRQGIGRLIRREGLQGRRLWVMDGRIVPHATASPRWRYVFELVRRELARYPRQAVFDLPPHCERSNDAANAGERSQDTNQSVSVSGAINAPD